jgi:hypothetical protein
MDNPPAWVQNLQNAKASVPANAHGSPDIRLMLLPRDDTSRARIIADCLCRFHRCERVRLYNLSEVPGCKEGGIALL